MGLRVLSGAAAWSLIVAVPSPAAGQAWAPGAASAAHGSSNRSLSDDMTAVWDAFTHTLSAPGRWQSEDWLGFGLAAAATTASTTFEEDFRRAMQRSRGRVGDVLERVGFWYGTPWLTVPASLLTYGAGAAFDSDGVRDTGLMMIDVMLLVGLVQQPLRMVAGRARPETGEEHFSFQPFTLANDRASFLSGHAWIAFGISNVVARQIDQGWAYAALFSLAGITAWSRLYADKHWLSDVLAGSLLGYFTSTTVWRWYQDQQHESDLSAVSSAPWIRFRLRF